MWGAAAARAAGTGAREGRAPWARHGRERNLPWHAGRARLPDGAWLAACDDGVSRLVVGHGLRARATPAAPVGALRGAVAEHGAIASVMTARAAPFYGPGGGQGGRGAAAFEELLVAAGTRHVLAGSGHARTNAKIARLFGEARARLDTLADVDEIVAWWNTAKPHRLPDFGAGETPCDALERGVPPAAGAAGVP